MGCQVTVQLEADKDAAEVMRDLPARFAAIESVLTRFNPESELMRFNTHAGEWVTVSDLLFKNIHAARHAALLTDGLFNPLVLPALVATGYDRSFEQIDTASITKAKTVHDWRGIELRPETREVRLPHGAKLDLGGIAKGWTATIIADELVHYGACLINIGGDMVGRGAPNGLPGWLVEIEDPFSNECFASLYLSDSSIVTSGIDYRNWNDSWGNQYHHIIDPRTGRSAVTDVLTATVLHPSGRTAEAYAKALILQGAEAGLQWLNQQWHTAGLIFRRDGAVLGTSTFTSLVNERNISS